MAARNTAVVIGQWVNAGGRNDSAALADAPSGVAVSDRTAQSGAAVPPSPNVGIFEVKGLTNAQLTGLKALPAYFVLMDKQYDDVTLIVSGSTYDNVPTGAQLVAFRDAIIERFPGVDEDTLTEAGQSVFRAGLTREQILALLITRWNRLPGLLT
jgi:hypothetical protein